MFGFGKTYDEEYLNLYEHLTKQWKMKSQYAKSFLNAYKKSIGKMFLEGKKRIQMLENGGYPEVKLMKRSNPGFEFDLVLIEQAYVAYMKDLRSGKHVGTSVEKSIWAILSNRPDLIENFDKNFSKWIYDNQEKEFPGLFEKVYDFKS